MGNHTKVFDLFAGKPAQRRLRALFAKFRATFDNPGVVNGRLCFALFAPGDRLDEALLRSLTVSVTDPVTGVTHEALINEVLQHDPSRSFYWLSTAALEPFHRDVEDCGPAYRLEITSSCGKHRFVGTATPAKRHKGT